MKPAGLMLIDRPTGAAKRVARGSERIPRTVTVCLTVAMVRHLFSAFTVAGSGSHIGPLDWVTLAAAELLLVVVALHAPSMFMVRTFRLTGVATAANALIILFPLPDVISVYGSLVPDMMIFSLAAGVATMALTFLVLSRWATSVREPRTDQRVPHESFLPVTIIAITAVVIPLWIATSGVPPLFSLFSGTSSSQLAIDRQNAFSHLGSAPLRLVLGILRNLLVMFAAGWFVADATTTDRRSWRKRSVAETTALAVAGFGVFFALLTTERAIVGELLAVCGIAWLVVRRRELTAGVVAVLVGAAAAFPLAVGILSGAGNPTEVVLGLRRRAFYLPTEVMTRYFIEFPLFHDHLGGSSIPKLSYLTGTETFDLSGFIYARYYQRSSGVIGNANGSFFGVGWANFGPVGVVLWALLAAVALVVLDRVIDRLPARSSAALRGLGVIMAVLTTSSDIFRNILGFLPGFLDLVVIVWLVGRLGERRSFRRRTVSALTSNTGQPLTVAVPASSD